MTEIQKKRDDRNTEEKKGQKYRRKERIEIQKKRDDRNTEEKRGQKYRRKERIEIKINEERINKKKGKKETKLIKFNNLNKLIKLKYFNTHMNMSMQSHQSI